MMSNASSANSDKMDTSCGEAVTVSITQIDVSTGVLPDVPSLSSSLVVSPITSTSVDIISIPSTNRSVEVTNCSSNFSITEISNSSGDHFSSQVNLSKPLEITRPATVTPISDSSSLPRSENNYESSQSIDLTSPCVVCNSPSMKGTELPDNHIFSPFCRTTYSSKTIAETLDRALELVLLPNTLHSEVVCFKCFKLLDLIDSLELQLRLKRNEVKTLYYNTQSLAYFRIDHRLTEEEPVKATMDPVHQETNLNSNEILDDVKSDNFKDSKPDLKIKSTEWLTSKTPIKKAKQSLVVKVPPQNVNVEPPRKSKKGLLTSDDLTCQLCHKPFEKRRYLMDHLRRTHKTPIYNCKGCDDKFASRSLLLRHIHKCAQFKQKQLIEDTEKEEASKVLTKRKKNNKCTMCSKWFLTKALLSVHREMEHFNKAKTAEEGRSEEENETEAPITCQLCNIVVNNDVALAIHASSVHGCERPWVCNICNKTFARRPELANHERIHTGEKPFQCDMCGATFNQKTNLHTHVRHSHLGEKRYPCMYCDQKFKRKRLLDCHVNAKHTFEKPYTCRVCPSAFAYPEHARKHELTHCKAKNFSCNECNKEFRTKLSLQRHVHQGCNKSKFFCGTCESNFTKKSALLDHLNKSGHPEGIIKQQENDTNQAFMVDNSASVALSIDEVEDVYDEGVVLYLSDRSVMDTSLYYHGAGVEGTGVEVSAEEEVQTAILSIAPDGGGGGREVKDKHLCKSEIHFVEGQIVHAAPGSFVEIATENL